MKQRATIINGTRVHLLLSCQKLVLLLGLNGLMGIIAELLIGVKPIAFDEFKATQTKHCNLKRNIKQTAAKHKVFIRFRFD